MARKVGQIIARGDRRWLIRVYLGRDQETNKRKYHNRTIHGRNSGLPCRLNTQYGGLQCYSIVMAGRPSELNRLATAGTGSPNSNESIRISLLVCRSFPLSSPHAICLTFDDGPHVRMTPRILKVLRSRQAHASFFIVGERLRARSASDIIAEALTDGHTLGNHSLTHRNLARCSEREIENEIRSTTALLERLGVACRYFRPPYGSVNEQLRRIVDRCGLQLVLWNNDPRDWDKRIQSNQWVDAALAAVEQRDARVILLHDPHETTAENLDQLLARLQEKGHWFSNLEEAETALGPR